MLNKRRTVLYRVITGICLILWIGFIFHNSLENGMESSSKSGAVMALIRSILGEDIVTEHLIRKLAHFTEYAIEGGLLVLVLRGYTQKIPKYFNWPLFVGLLTALIDETIQLFSDGRAGMITDVWIDFSGVIVGSLIIFVCLIVLGRFKLKKYKL